MSKKLFAILATLLLLLGLTAAVSSQSSGRFNINIWNVTNGGGTSNSTSYTLSSAIGQPNMGELQGTRFDIRGGYWSSGSIATPQPPAPTPTSSSTSPPGASLTPTSTPTSTSSALATPTSSSTPPPGASLTPTSTPTSTSSAPATPTAMPAATQVPTAGFWLYLPAVMR